MAFTRRMTVLAACALIGCKTPMGATRPQATVSLVDSRATALDGPLEKVSTATAESQTCRQPSSPTGVMAKVVAYQSENSPSIEPPLPAAGPVDSDPLEPLSDNTPSPDSEPTDLPIPEAGKSEFEKPNPAAAVNVGDGVSVGVDSSVPAKATTASLTLQQLEELALANSPALSEAAARVESLRGNWVQVGLPPNTVLGYSGQQIFSGGAAEQQGLYVGQHFVRGGKLQLNRAVVAQEVRKAETEWQAQRQRVLTDVRLGYYEVLIAQRRNQVAEELVRIAEQAVTTAESLLEAREVSQVDVMRARVELQTDELLLKNALNQQQSAWSRLVAVLGQPNMQITTLAGNLEGSLQRVDMEETVARLMANSPQMIAAGIEVDRARSILRRQRVEPVPNVDVQAIAQSDNGTSGSNAAVQVTFPLPWLDRNQGAIQQAYADLVAAERATNRMELKLQKRLATVYQSYANASNQVEDYSKSGGILENSRRTLEYVGKGYRAGEIGYLDLLTAQRTYAATNLAYLEALGELWSALVEIDGLLLRDSLEEDRGGINAGN